MAMLMISLNNLQTRHQWRSFASPSTSANGAAPAGPPAVNATAQRRIQSKRTPRLASALLVAALAFGPGISVAAEDAPRLPTISVPPFRIPPPLSAEGEKVTLAFRELERSLVILTEQINAVVRELDGRLRLQRAASGKLDERFAEIRAQFRDMEALVNKSVGRLDAMSAQSEGISGKINDLRGQVGGLLVETELTVAQLRNLVSAALVVADKETSMADRLSTSLLFVPILIVLLIVLSVVLIYSVIWVLRLRRDAKGARRELGVLSDFMRLFPRENPYVAGSPVIQDAMFFGRRDLIRKIVNGIHNNHYYLMGGRRSGKTSLLKRLEQKLEGLKRAGTDFQPVPFDFQSISEDRLYNGLAAALLRGADRLCMRRGQAPVTDRWKTERDARAGEPKVSDEFVEIFDDVDERLREQNSKSVVFVLLIDEFDKINDFELVAKEELRSMFMQDETSNLRLVAAGGPIKIWDRSSPFNFMIEEPIGSLNDEDARALIEGPSRGVVRWTDEAIKRVLERSANEPYQIQLTCAQAVDYAINHELFHIEAAIIDTVIKAMPSLDGELQHA